MPRVIPTCPANAPPAVAKPDEYRIKLITPLFGGGAEAGVNDPSMPIRATSIRGQLQFWWRATRGAAFAPLEEMRARHREVWGATNCASPVSVEVVDVQADPPVPCGRYDQGSPRLTWGRPFANTDLPYALFPFQGKNNGPQHERKAPASCTPAAGFTVRLRYPDSVRDDVVIALQAWVNFGGLGARTRRGCGSLFCDRVAFKDTAALGQWLRAQAIPEGRAWPTLPRSVLVRTDADDSLLVWSWTVGLLRHFRQGASFGRNPGNTPNRPGRSRFPEPEVIRETLRANRNQSGHQRLTAIPSDAVPRAEFGLPIVFHYQGHGEPPDTTLQPVVNDKPADRMASPLILKPLALANGKAVPLVLRLLTPPLTGAVLMQGNQERRRFGPEAIRRPQLASYDKSPLAGSPAGSALEAFLDFARSENMTEVPA